MGDTYIVYRRTNDLWNMGHYHFHEQYEILLSLSGNAQMFVTDRCYPLEYGTLILLSPAVLHRSVADANRQYERLVMRFHQQYADTLSTTMTNLLRCFGSGRVRFQLDGAQIDKLVDLYADCMENHTGYGADLKRDTAFIRFMLYVDELTNISDLPVLEQSNTPKGNIGELIRYIPDHLNEDLTLDALAQRFYISKPHLCRIFKEYTGFPLGEYIIKSRIMHARRLLQEGKSVQEAGEGSGFRSYAHFIRTFRQIVGVSPGKYRNNFTQ